jgi:hypothetical protein
MLPPLHPSMLPEKLRSFKGAPMTETQLPKRKGELDDVGDIRRFRRVRLLDAVNRSNVYRFSALFSLVYDHEWKWHHVGTGFGRTHHIQVSP